MHFFVKHFCSLWIIAFCHRMPSIANTQCFSSLTKSIIYRFLFLCRMKTSFFLKPVLMLVACLFLMNVQSCKDPLQGDIPRTLEPVISTTEWQQMNGLHGSVTCFATNGNSLFAGAYVGGIFRSDNNGALWQAVNNSLKNTDLQSLIASGNTLFAGINGEGILRSTDNGATWQVMNSGLTSLSIYCLAASENTLFAGTVPGQTSAGGLFRSTDNGTTWQELTNGLTSKSIQSLTISENSLFAGTDKGLFRSIDNGMIWQAVNNGLTNAYIKSLTAVRGSILFAGRADGGGVFRSMDNGITWQAVNNGLRTPAPAIISLTANGNTVFAGTSDGVFRLNNNGDSWQAVGIRLANILVLSLAVKGNTLFAGTNGEGAFRIGIPQ